MLYDPKWDRDSLVGLRDWLARQPASTSYNWSSCENCVVGRYLTAHGRSSLDYNEWINDVPGATMAVPSCFADFAIAGGRQNMTYGRALENLDNWLAKYADTLVA
jgi:hypothetical protein